MGAAVRGADGRMFAGVNLFHFTGGSCAELVALGSARANGGRGITTIVAVGNHRRGVVGPCGRDRQVLFDYYPGIRVLLPTIEGVRVATIEHHASARVARRLGLAPTTMIVEGESVWQLRTDVIRTEPNIVRWGLRFQHPRGSTGFGRSRSRVYRMSSLEPVLVSVTSPISVEAEEVSLRYYEDIVGRYYGRPASRQEVLDAQAGYPSDDLAAPTGLFLLARHGTVVLGCAGVRVRPGNIGEVTKVFVSSTARGRGVGRLLMEDLERRSRGLGLTALRLDTRSDLLEARGLYVSLGFIEGEAHNEDPYANHWFRKELLQTTSS